MFTVFFYPPHRFSCLTYKQRKFESAKCSLNKFIYIELSVDVPDYHCCCRCCCYYCFHRCSLLALHHSFPSFIQFVAWIQWNWCISGPHSHTCIMQWHTHSKEWKQQCLPDEFLSHSLSLYLCVRPFENKNKSVVPIWCVELFKHVALSIVYYEYAIAINFIASKHCVPSHLHVVNNNTTESSG